MCDKCATDARTMFLAMLTASLSTPIDVHTFHGQDVDVNALRTNLAEIAQAIMLGVETPTPEQEAAATTSDARLTAMPAAMLQDLMIYCEYIEGLHANMHRITQLILAQRAMAGEKDAQVRISQLDAIRAIALANIPDAEKKDGAIFAVAIEGLGAKVSKRHTHATPASNTSDLPH